MTMPIVFGPGTWSMDYLVTGGWAYAPIGDIYPLEPIWTESHAVSGETVNDEDERNHYSMVAAYVSDIDPYFILQVTQDDPDTDEIEQDVPTGEVNTEARLWLPFGFEREHSLLVERIVSGTAPDEVWTGKFKITFTKAVRVAIGPDVVARLAIDFWMTGDLERIRLAYGDVVFRR